MSQSGSRSNDWGSPVRLSGGDWRDAWMVDLDEPLGDRELIDGSRGAVVEVRYQPWNQHRNSEAEYRRALEATVARVLEADPNAEASVVDDADGPELHVDLGDLPDGQSRIDPGGDFIHKHLDPVRH